MVAADDVEAGVDAIIHRRRAIARARMCMWIFYHYSDGKLTRPRPYANAESLLWALGVRCYPVTRDPESGTSFFLTLFSLFRVSCQ